METGFVPTKKRNFIKWLLEEAKKNEWTVVLEYECNEVYPLLLKRATEEALPESASHNYHKDYILTAIKNPIVSNSFISTIFKCSALSLHQNNKMIFLAADDFHKDCFTCSLSFYNQYSQSLRNNDLIRQTFKKQNAG